MNKQQATEVIQGFVKQIGLGFHIDTQMREYYNPGGEPVFTERQAEKNQKLLNRACDALEALGIDPYQIGLDAMRPMILAIQPDAEITELKS